MRFRLAFDREGSEQFVEALCNHIEKQKQHRATSVPNAVENCDNIAETDKTANSHKSMKDIESILLECEEAISNATAEIEKDITNESYTLESSVCEEDSSVYKAAENEGVDAQICDVIEEKQIEADKVADAKNVRENIKLNKVNKRPDNIKRLSDNKNNKKKISISKIFGRIGISISSLIVVVLAFALTLNLVLIYGPSESIRNIYVNSVTETSAMKFLAYWFMDDKEVENIINNSKPQDDGDTTDTSIIEFPDYSGSENGEVDINNIELIDIQGKTYNGKMLIIQNPKRVYLGTPEAYGNDKQGVTTIDMVKKENALYGVNGGGFFDTGAGNGGIPTGRGNSSGVVISKGKLMWGSKSSKYEIIGINKQGVLVLGKMTAQEALDSGIVEALNFGPYLIKDGVPCEISDGSHGLGGLNPRTAIGQRKDGAILLLTIDGRQASGLGASYKDLIEIMMSYDAVNAANLDGGSSTYMVQNSETGNNPQIITQCASLYGPRQVATSVLVSRVDQINEQYE